MSPMPRSRRLYWMSAAFFAGFGAGVALVAPAVLELLSSFF